jgi:hypothetical protein
MSIPNSFQPIPFKFDLPDRPESLENYPNLLNLCNQIIENMESFNNALQRIQNNLAPEQRLKIVDGLSHTAHEIFDLSLHLQQHLGLLSDSDEEIHLQEPLINYLRAVINNASRIDKSVFAAQEAIDSYRPHHR